MMEFGLSPEVLAALAKRFPEMFKPGAGPTWQQQVLAKGWGYAVYIPTSVQTDNGEGLTEGVIGLVNKGQPRGLDDWGALRAWAWGASRALDYFETDKSVDAKQVGVEGHSRYGKAALVAMAYDSRFAIAYISSSGEGGAKLFRRNFGEQIGNVAGTGEYHWMAGNFLKYAGPLTENDLPVDAHELIALCAPRPVFIGAGATSGDGWVDAKGMFLAAVGAGPVYKLLGGEGTGNERVSFHRDGADRWRHCVPSTQRRAYAGAELAYVSDVCRSVFEDAGDFVKVDAVRRTQTQGPSTPPSLCSGSGRDDSFWERLRSGRKRRTPSC